MLKGLIRQVLGRKRAGQAAPQAENAGVLLELGLEQHALGNAAQARAAFERAAALDPRSARARFYLGNLAHEDRRHEDAVAFYRAALGIDDRDAAVHCNLGWALMCCHEAADAVDAYRRALAKAPDYAAALGSLQFALYFSERVGPDEIYAEHRRWAALCADPLQPASSSLRWLNPAQPQRRLRVGYVSPYFYDQPVAYFIEPLLAHHDRSAFELFLYSDVAQPDALTQRLRGHADHWREMRGLDDAKFCEQVRADRIDILVDLTGHNAYHRLLAFARRPAPLQVSYLAPNTTGLRTMDYRITDNLADPRGAEALYSEQLLRLPRAQWAYQPPEAMPEPGPLPALANGYVTFGSFNSPLKLNAATMVLWAELLARVPDSRLQLLGVVSPERIARLRQPLLARGIAPERVRFLPHPPYERYWDAYHGVDIALDSHPFNGVTTTLGCLWMGLPVVSLSGAGSASRYGASLLGHLGAPQWLGQDSASFVDAAARLALDTAALARTRSGLRAWLRASPLLDGASLARDIESAYRGIWQDWCRRQA